MGVNVVVAIVAWVIALLVVGAVVTGWVVGRRRKRNDAGPRTRLTNNERMVREAELQRGQSQAIDKTRQFFSH